MTNLYRADDEVFIIHMNSYRLFYQVDDDSFSGIVPDYQEVDIEIQKGYFSKKEIDILLSLDGQQINLYLRKSQPKHGGEYSMYFNAFINHIIIDENTIKYNMFYKQVFTKYEPEIKSKIRKQKIKNVLDG